MIPYDSNIFPNNYHANIVQSKNWCIAKTPPLFSNYRNQDTLGATSQDVPSPKVWLIMNGPPRCVLNQTTSFVLILEKNTLTNTQKKSGGDSLSWTSRRSSLTNGCLPQAAWNATTPTLKMSLLVQPPNVTCREERSSWNVLVWEQVNDSSREEGKLNVPE